MAAWRIAIRGRYTKDNRWLDDPDEMWPRCRELGVAAITYFEVMDVDFGGYANPHEVPDWRGLKGSRRQSLRRLIWEIQPGDALYVKQGPMIVGKGIVQGGYRFDQERRLFWTDGRKVVYWPHQRQVAWCPNFHPVRIQI